MGSEVHRKPELEMHLEQSPSSTSPFVDKEIGQLRGREAEGGHTLTWRSRDENRPIPRVVDS